MAQRTKKTKAKAKARKKASAKKLQPTKKIVTGGPEKIGYDLIDRIAERVKAGDFYDTACILCGVHRTTMNVWLRRADKEPDSIYAHFLSKLEAAKAHFESSCLERLNMRPEDLKWRLEKMDPRRFGKKDHLRIEDENTKDSVFGEQNVHKFLVDFVEKAEKEGSDK